MPVDAVCGDGVKEGAEECDVASIGCVECHVAKGFSCTETDCTTTCGDGIRAGDEQCEPPDGTTCDSSCQTATKSEACDMNGYWIVRQTSFSIDDVVNQVQTASNWYAYKLSQTGTGFQVERALACGIYVTGSATVSLDDAATRALLSLNPQDETSPRGPRRGTFAPSGDGCDFEMDRHYMVRGVDPSFLPANFLAKPDLATLPPLPYEDDPEHPTGAHLEGAVDTDGDGKPGLAFRLTGNASGVRNAAQRDWNEYYTDSSFQIPAQAIEFTAGTRFDNQENILVVSRCPLIGCGLLLAGSVPAIDLKHRVTFRYLGKSLDEPRVAAVFTAEPGASPDSDFATCANVRAALAHDPSKE